jgi:hypothetical protein
VERRASMLSTSSKKANDNCMKLKPANTSKKKSFNRLSIKPAAGNRKADAKTNAKTETRESNHDDARGQGRRMEGDSHHAAMETGEWILATSPLAPTDPRQGGGYAPGSLVPFAGTCHRV